LAPEASGREGCKEARTEGKEVYKRSGAAVVEAKQRVQLQKTNTLYLPILSLSYKHSYRIAFTATHLTPT